MERGVYCLSGVGHVWKIRDRERRVYCLTGVGHVRKIRDRERRTDTGKYSFVNGSIENWNQLPVGALVSLFVKLEFLES
jgi:RNA polymerase-interacting CarD/CdnL/TRCF family regulator